MVSEAGFGSWQSPITSASLTAQQIGISQLRYDGEAVYWVESRPEERGRNCIVRQCGEQRRDVTPAPINVRSRAHEYGGQAYCVFEGRVFFSCHDDQRIYRIDSRDSKALPEAVTAENAGSFADHVFDEHFNRILCIRERKLKHREEPEASIIAIDPETGKIETLVSGDDFYSNISISPDGQHLSWLAWNHPAMPWDHTTLWLGELDKQGRIVNSKKLIDRSDVSLFQPQWADAETLFLVSDQSGWWNIYRYRLRNDELRCVLPMEAEFGLPQWVFGMSTFRIVDSERLACCCTRDGQWRLLLLSLSSGDYVDLSGENTWFYDLQVAGDSLLYQCGNSHQAPQLVLHKLNDHQKQVLQSACGQLPDTGYLSSPEAFSFASSQGAVAHAVYYPPVNRDFTAPEDEKPPLIVLCHGGPTGATESLFNPKIQFWTSRGFAVADINYRGSTGYGRQYRDALKGLWGIADVDDCVYAAQHLVERGLVDGARLAIKGSSAGGYTVLSALTFHAVFNAGASYYGIGDLEALLKDTHKFEARYLDSLIGFWPEQAQRYHDRSPINFSEQLNCPCIFLQGMKDKVVPPNQAQHMVNALEKQGIPVALVTFDQEAHGFRQAANIRKAIEAELYFYSRVFGFQLPDATEPVTIRNATALTKSHTAG